MNAALHLVITLAICTCAIGPLARAQWVWRAPRVGIALWQMLALTWLLCAVGTLVAIGLAPYGKDIPQALGRWLGTEPVDGFTTLHLVVLVAGFGLAVAVPAALAVSWISVLRLRRRHRDLLGLVARQDAAAPGALILDHPLAVAYCLPGIRGKVVLSSGALESLTSDQLAAVLAHEQTHMRERHDLVLLPFAALRRLAPRSRMVGLAIDAVALLVEMRADEGACQRQQPASLALALSRFGAVSPPPGALGVTEAVLARIERITNHRRPLPITARWLAVVTGLVLVSTPLSFLVI
ncbi:peptidase M48 Ste24p [Kibdelosporangium aridum]|uniref:Peptidase M48 Ste24p n=1 Tax=Kibdelosporangium aridum TaxID=2030 RepID=A0A428Z4X0_KIBAR|nr:M56 family metallopeptidase [Kibdelosporangium aridum]RSM81674.1 peptidase M48 Ste24p [Kibdelosporangium aridum]